MNIVFVCKDYDLTFCVVFFPSLFKVEEQQRKALEEDPTIFDYDGVYDKMKEKVARPLIQDREERKVRLQFFQNFFYKFQPNNTALCL